MGWGSSDWVRALSTYVPGQLKMGTGYPSFVHLLFETVVIYPGTLDIKLPSAIGNARAILHLTGACHVDNNLA